jgi:hypothetical protein
MHSFENVRSVSKSGLGIFLLAAHVNNWSNICLPISFIVCYSSIKKIINTVIKFIEDQQKLYLLGFKL